MALKLNSRLLLAAVFVFACICSVAQDEAGEERTSDKDYKNKAQFEKFYKRRKMIGAWQINQLKTGALVVRLKTNRMLIESLTRAGDTIMAQQKQFEADAINITTIRAYLYNYSFSKVYFIYSNSSDSLLNGARDHIFVDSTLRINPAIHMTENFYLLAERDYAYNSTIGFVPEDSARLVKETGYGVKEMAVIIKNKYGHQLKKPFPYAIADRPNLKLDQIYVMNISINGVDIPFNIGGVGNVRKNNRNGVNYKYHGHLLALHIPRYLTYDRLAISISNLDEALKNYFRAHIYVGSDRTDPSVKPYLY